MKILQLKELFPNIEEVKNVIKFEQYGFYITKTKENKIALQYPFYTKQDNNSVLDERFIFEISEDNLLYLISNCTLYKGFIQKNLFVIENEFGLIEVLPIEHESIKKVIKENKKELVIGKEIFDIKSSISFQKAGFKKIYFGKIKNIFTQKKYYYFGIYNQNNICIEKKIYKEKPICLLDKETDININKDNNLSLSFEYI